jgi:aspartate/methionine/tyrosine aminotransferase
MFASRLPGELAPNRVSRAAAAARQSGIALLDLTETNPTAVGLPYPAGLLAPLGDPRGLRYEPDARGLRRAREVVASAQSSDRTRPLDPDRIVLTASTSEAYSVLFKLLCNPGDEVLTPQPSYPLFDLLTRLDGVVSRPYRIEHHGLWSIDRGSVRDALTPLTRAILIVSPNNPTGSLLREADRAWLLDLAAGRGLGLIADEVFADYPLAPEADACTIGGPEPGPPDVLTFTLGGLSKSIGLPQAKLAWICVDGPDGLAADALERLDLIADTYLSVSTAVQVALDRLLECGRPVRDAIRTRIRRNLDALAHAVQAHPAVSLLTPEAGWSAVLRVPAIRPEETLVLRLIEEQHVLVHPGYFFDFAAEAYLVVSLLPEPEIFDEALARLLPVAAGAG